MKEPRLMAGNELSARRVNIRARLEKEKARLRRRNAIDIKYGAGGMLDVYFAVRYLQLRDDISDEGDDRSTRATLDRLAAASSLETADTGAQQCYELLRAVESSSAADCPVRLRVYLPSIIPSPKRFGEAWFQKRGRAARALIGRMQAIRAVTMASPVGC